VAFATVSSACSIFTETTLDTANVKEVSLTLSDDGNAVSAQLAVTLTNDLDCAPESLLVFAGATQLERTQSSRCEAPVYTAVVPNLAAVQVRDGRNTRVLAPAAANLEMISNFADEKNERVSIRIPLARFASLKIRAFGRDLPAQFEGDHAVVSVPASAMVNDTLSLDLESDVELDAKQCDFAKCAIHYKTKRTIVVTR
jgi:hypothetical protein